MSPERTPVPRLTVTGYALVGLLLLIGLIALSDALRLEHPATGPLTPEVAEEDIDPLREEVPCPVAAGREGTDREQATTLPALPQEVTSNQLYDCPQFYDGQTILYTGEVVGALLARDHGVWSQLNDDVYGDVGAPLPTHRDFRGGNAGVGVLLPADIAATVGVVGGPGFHGDVLRVTGRFQRVDEATGEVAIIRVASAELVQEGRALEVPDSPARPVVASIAALIALAVTVVERRSRTRR